MNSLSVASLCHRLFVAHYKLKALNIFSALRFIGIIISERLFLRYLFAFYFAKGFVLQKIILKCSSWSYLVAQSVLQGGLA
jgi:hypothetical protein